MNSYEWIVTLTYLLGVGLTREATRRILTGISAMIEPEGLFYELGRVSVCFAPCICCVLCMGASRDAASSQQPSYNIPLFAHSR